jgi:hypothetical protein
MIDASSKRHISRALPSLDAEAGSILDTAPVYPFAVAVHTVPHPKLGGQQPPPTSVPQLSHPNWHAPERSVVVTALATPVISAVVKYVLPPARSPCGTTIVTPLDTMVWEAVAEGQLVREQSRPMRQQPGR